MKKNDFRDKTFKERYSPKIPFKRYLFHPLGRASSVEEGYIYTQKEHSIHGNFFHRGIDFSADYGDPVFACADGYAVASYHRFTVTNPDGTLKLYKRKPFANGYGYFVQIYHPYGVSGVEGGRITQYGHLSRISPEIRVKKTKPLKADHIRRIQRKNAAKRENALGEKQLSAILSNHQHLIRTYPWVSHIYGFSFTDDSETQESYIWNLDHLKKLHKEKNQYVTWVEQDQEIGNVGTSAVFWGNPPYNENLSTPSIPEYETTWDETHLHFEEAARDPQTGLKHSNRDPYDIYKSKRWYTTRHIKRSLFIPVPI